MDNFWKEITVNRKTARSKVKKFIPKVLRGIEEAKIFMGFEESLRLKILDNIVRLQDGPKNKRVISVDVYDDTNGVPVNLRDSIQQYIEAMEAYDKITDENENEQKKNRLSKALKEEFTNEAGWMGSLKVLNQLESPQPSPVEKTNLRQSTRVIEKRRLSVLSMTSNESNSTGDVTQPAKKRRLSRASTEDNVPLEEKFKFSPKDITSLFKNAPNQTVCMGCFTHKPDEPDLHKCIGGCQNYYHEKCSHNPDVKDEIFRHVTGDSDMTLVKRIVKFTCEMCSNDEKFCFICKTAIAEDNKYDCNMADCKQHYHKSCLEKCFQSNLRNPGLKSGCPQHECHTCIWKTIDRNSAVVKVF